MRRAVILLAVTLAFTAVQLAARPVLNEDAARTRELVRARKWDELEREMRTYAKDQPRLPSGRRRLYACYSAFEDMYDEADRKLLEEWVAARPESHAALAALGKATLDWAWDARGSGYANTITDEGSRLFGERLAESRRLLEKAAGLTSNDPGPATFLITVSRAQGGPLDERRRWLDKALAMDPGETVAASSYQEGLYRKWGGSDEAALAFAREMVAKAPAGTRFPELIVDAHLALARASGDDNYFARPEVRQEVEAALTQLVTDFPRCLWCHELAAFIALTHGDAHAAKPHLDVVGADYQEGLWSSEAEYEHSRREVDQVVGPRDKQRRSPKAMAQARKDGSLIPTEVTLLDAGAEPRAPLRLSLEAGATRTTRLRIDGSIEQAVYRGASQLGGDHLDLRPEELTLSATVRDVAPDGAATVDLVVLDARLGEEPVRRSVAQSAEVLAAMAGATGHVVLDDCGAARDVSFGAPAGAPESLRFEWQRLAQPWVAWCMPFPAEAIGVGAKWKIAGSWWVEGDILDQDTTCELRERDGNHVVIAGDGFSEGGRKRIAVRGVPPGTPCEVASSDVVSWSDVVMDVGRPLPEAAPTHLTTHRHVCIGDAHVQDNTISVMTRELGLDWSDVASPQAQARPSWDASHPGPEREDRLAVAAPITPVEPDASWWSLAMVSWIAAIAAIGLLLLLVLRRRRRRTVVAPPSAA